MRAKKIGFGNGPNVGGVVLGKDTTKSWIANVREDNIALKSIGGWWGPWRGRYWVLDNQCKRKKIMVLQSICGWCGPWKGHHLMLDSLKKGINGVITRFKDWVLKCHWNWKPIEKKSLLLFCGLSVNWRGNASWQMVLLVVVWIFENKDPNETKQPPHFVSFQAVSKSCRFASPGSPLGKDTTEYWIIRRMKLKE